MPPKQEYWHVLLRQDPNLLYCIWDVHKWATPEICASPSNWAYPSCRSITTITVPSSYRLTLLLRRHAHVSSCRNHKDHSRQKATAGRSDLLYSEIKRNKIQIRAILSYCTDDTEYNIVDCFLQSLVDYILGRSHSKCRDTPALCQTLSSMRWLLTRWSNPLRWVIHDSLMGIWGCP